MMQTGIMRLSEGGTPTGMTPQMAADFISWFKGRFGNERLGPNSWNTTKMLWLKDSGYKTYGNSLKEYFQSADVPWEAYVNWVTGGGANDTDTDTDTDGPQTVFPAGSDVPSIMDYENGDIITVGDIKYILTNNIWKEYEEPGSTDTNGDYGTDASGKPLPNPNDPKYGEGAVYGVGDDLYIVINGKWEKVGGQSSGGSNQGGLFGLGIGPWLKNFFGATGVGGDILSGIFGEGGNIADLLKLFLQGKAYKEAWDAATYEVPTGQGAAMSDFEKDNPFTGNMTLAGMGPNYLQGQDYGIPVGQQGLPAATHKIGKPFVEEVQGGQSGGIMNAKGHGDVVPALLEPDEFVFTRKAVQNMGGGDVRQGAKQMYQIMKNLERMG